MLKLFISAIVAVGVAMSTALLVVAGLGIASFGDKAGPAARVAVGEATDMAGKVVHQVIPGIDAKIEDLEWKDRVNDVQASVNQVQNDQKAATKELQAVVAEVTHLEATRDTVLADTVRDENHLTTLNRLLATDACCQTITVGTHTFDRGEFSRQIAKLNEQVQRRNKELQGYTKLLAIKNEHAESLRDRIAVAANAAQEGTVAIAKIDVANSRRIADRMRTVTSSWTDSVDLRAADATSNQLLPVQTALATLQN